MKFIVLAILAFAAIAAAAPAAPVAPAVLASLAAQAAPAAPAAAAARASATQAPIQILRSDFDQQPDGAYVYNFETENHIVRQEDGTLKEILDEDNKPQMVVVVRGSYSYIDNDGNPVSINYFADETGFHAEGDTIPKVPAPARR